jgi:hypothetical protein
MTENEQLEQLIQAAEQMADDDPRWGTGESGFGRLSLAWGSGWNARLTQPSLVLGRASSAIADSRYRSDGMTSKVKI